MAAGVPFIVYCSTRLGPAFKFLWFCFVNVRLHFYLSLIPRIFSYILNLFLAPGCINDENEYEYTLVVVVKKYLLACDHTHFNPNLDIDSGIFLTYQTFLDLSDISKINLAFKIIFSFSLNE